nr:hypothetical protein [Tanacetum cinerariifolium]
MILVAQSEASKVENASAEMLRGLDQQMEKKEDGDVVESVGTQLDMSITYHNQTDGQSESIIQTLEVILRTCVIDFKARDHQKSYADSRHKPLEFEVGDQVLLKVSSWKGVVPFGEDGKLAPRLFTSFLKDGRGSCGLDASLRIAVMLLFVPLVG